VIATDRESKKSKGFAFVEMSNDDDAAKVIEAFNNKPLNGRPMKVCHDRGKGGGGVSSSPSSRSDKPEQRKREYLPPIQRMQLFRRRKKLDPFLEDPSKTVDYKDISLLSKFVSERGRILSRRMTGLTAYNQRKIAKAIKRAQSVGLMPYQR
ncbi:MAG: 30S ribosomal protein S18, partial [Bdellovibrionales bacterium]|nr:30S ribosomal protein S18 [Bdellovibrionales bacterium]